MPVVAELGPKPFGQHEVVRLGGGVVRDPHHSLQRAHRRQQDDSAATTCPESFTETVDEDERSPDVDVDLLEMRVDVEIPERPDDGERRVVDQQAHIDVGEFGEDAVEVGAASEIRAQRTRVHAGCRGDVVGEPLCELHPPSDEHDVESPVRAPARQCLSEPFGCPGDHGPRAVALREGRHVRCRFRR